MPRPKLTTIEKFWSLVEITEDGCWIWKGKINQDNRKPRKRGRSQASEKYGKGGYPYIWVDGKWVRAHRWSFQYFMCDLSTTAELDHLCNDRRCVCPYHLEPVTHLTNNQRRTRRLLMLAQNSPGE